MGTPIPHKFPTRTRWSIILDEDSGTTDATRAAAYVAEHYLVPLRGFVVARGYSPDEAEDLIQDFMLRALQKKSVLASADPKRGKMRTFLIACLKNHIENERIKKSALRRGGGAVHVEIDDSIGSGEDPPPPEYDRIWFQTLIDRACKKALAEYTSRKKAELGEALVAAVLQDTKDYSEIAGRVGMNPTAVKVAAHRFRKRLRELVRSEVYETVANVEAAEEELAILEAYLKS